MASYHPKRLQWLIQDFPDGAPTPEEGTNLLFGIIIAENCNKMKKKIGLGRASFVPPDPPLLHKMTSKLQQSGWRGSHLEMLTQKLIILRTLRRQQGIGSF